MQNRAKHEGLEAFSYLTGALENFQKLVDNIEIPEGDGIAGSEKDMLRFIVTFSQNFIQHFEADRADSLRFCEQIFSNDFTSFLFDLIKETFNDESRAKNMWMRMRNIIEKDNQKLHS